MAWISLNNLTRFFKQMLVKNITWKGRHTFASNATFSGGLSSSGTNLTGTTTIQGDFTVVDGIKVFARQTPNLQPVQIMTVDINGLKYKDSLVATKADITASAGFQNPATKTLNMGDQAVAFGDCTIKHMLSSFRVYSTEYPIVLKVNSTEYSFDSDSAYFDNITVANNLVIPGGKIWIA